MLNPFNRTGQAVIVGLALLTPGVGRAPVAQSGSSAAAKVDVESVGPKVGARLPDFNLRDQRGESHSLKSLLGPKGAIIVFFRSADW